ncbi:hypothetical protein AWB69_05876 [Caballeronia udeis]|uniref:Uncharacterized protein n=1 Tax=Caballeronia udeis TaxID=1232866 RepID=A0A158IGE8_9BURK|nr:hypothetical protein AWB69_05876 [Caballeronia udeis]
MAERVNRPYRGYYIGASARAYIDRLLRNS